jgi:hypothetical protein
MKRLFAISGIFLFCCLTAAPPCRAQKTGAASARTRGEYVRRTQIIARDTRFALGQFFVAWEEMEALDARSRRRETEDELADKAKRRDVLRAVLLKSLPTIRANAKRLRSVSPVPRVFIKADDRFVSAGYALDAAMTDLESWLVQPADEWKSQTEKHLRAALTDLVSGGRLLQLRSESEVVNKLYVD